jgi:hypothetical protein
MQVIHIMLGIGGKALLDGSLNREVACEGERAEERKKLVCNVKGLTG